MSGASARAIEGGDRPSVADRWRPLLPGLGFAVGLALVALAIEAAQRGAFGRPWVESIVLALLLGVVVRNSALDLRPFEKGAAYAGKQVLELAVVLLGAGIVAGDLVAAGPGLAAAIVLGVAAALAVGFVGGRMLGLGWRLALLVATGNAICGNSAIAAVAPVIGAKKEEVASAIALTAVLGLVVVLALPALIPIFGLSHYQYGVLAGMSVYAVPQVVAAAFPVSDLSGEVATMTKLARVMLLGPLVLLVGLLMALVAGKAGRAKGGLGTFVPWFVVGFVALGALRSLGLLPDPLAGALREAGKWLTVVAMAGLGMGVKLAAIRAVGPKVFGAVILSLAVLIALTLVLIRAFGIDGGGMRA
jgi:uncharacterized integral membrane protein (TIGR00698 family)